MQSDDEGAGVVVDAVAAPAGGDGEGRVLDDACIVGETQQVIEPQLGKAAGPRLLSLLTPEFRMRLSDFAAKVPFPRTRSFGP